MQAHTTQDMDDMDSTDNDDIGVEEAFSFGWAIKLLEPGRINGGGREVPQASPDDQERAANMNRILFEYLEDQSANGRDMDSITDGEIVHTIARVDANERDTVPGNVLQWMGRNCRIISSGEDSPTEMYTKKEVESIKQDIERRAYREGLRDGMKEDE